MPMIDASAGDISVAGKGTPVIYINGHQMRDQNELELLTSKDLDSLEIITNPSSKYGSEVSSVILIKTKKRMNGLYASVRNKDKIRQKKYLRKGPFKNIRCSATRHRSVVSITRDARHVVQTKGLPTFLFQSLQKL